MRIGCVGMATLDTLLFVPDHELLDDAVASIEEAVFCPGGKGVVTAVAIEEAGGEVVPLCLLGEESRLDTLLPVSLDRRYRLPLLVRDSRTWITISQAQKVITFVAREEVPPEQEETALAAVARLVDEVDGLYLTVEDPRILRAALEGARARGLPVALNASIPLLELLLPGHRDLLVDLVATSDVVLCNHREGPRFLAALKVDEWSAAPGPARREVVVTEGEAGGRFREGDLGDWTSFEAVAPESIRCVVGAGDTFNGGYLVARWGGGATVAQSCRRGAELAARKVAVRSSMLPSGQPTSAS